MFKVKFHQIIIKGGGASEIFCTKEVLTQEFDVKFYEILHSGKIFMSPFSWSCSYVALNIKSTQMKNS